MTLWGTFAVTPWLGAQPRREAEVPLELDLSRGEPAILLARSVREGSLLIPLRAFLEALGVFLVQGEPETWCGHIQERRFWFCLDPRRRRITTRRQSFMASEAEWQLEGEELFVSIPVLERLLEARLELDMQGLRLRIIPQGPVPPALVKAHLRELKETGLNWEFLPSWQESPPYIPRKLWQPGLLEYTLSWERAGRAPRPRALWRAGVLLLGGDLEASGIVQAEPRFRMLRSDLEELRWRWSFLRPWLRQITAGSFPLPWLPNATVRGLWVQNTPPYLERGRGWVTEEGFWPPGTRVEVYQNGIFIGRVRVPQDGRLLLRVPLLEGANELRLQAITPTGERLQETISRTIPYYLLPFGAWRYELIGGLLHPESLPVLGARLAAGLGPQLTLQAGLVRVWKSAGGPLSTAYWGALGAALGSWGLWQAEALWPFRYQSSIQLRGSRGLLTSASWQGSWRLCRTTRGMSSSTARPALPFRFGSGGLCSPRAWRGRLSAS
ncbi:MAG: hypothetical protein RML47_09890 [Bacteroidota bacterium]|nr:hypothetical protein [Bacteroidota bacterium]